jgi:hypothetical protein
MGVNAPSPVMTTRLKVMVSGGGEMNYFFACSSRYEIAWPTVAMFSA